MFAGDLVAAMDREVSRRPSINWSDGNGRAALMAYSRAESFLYFEFPSDVYEQVSKEFKTELEYRRAMRAFEERLEAQRTEGRTRWRAVSRRGAVREGESKNSNCRNGSASTSFEMA